MPGDLNADFTFKVVLLGATNVGKTSIFQRYKDGTFHPFRTTTTGIDTFSKRRQFDHANVAVVLWDTAGSERFRTITQNYYRNSNACLLVYSVDEPDSFISLKQWLNDASTYSESAIKILVGNKTDKQSFVDDSKAKEFADQHDCDLIFQVSAKLGDGIEDMFSTIFRKLLDREIQKRQSVGNVFENVIGDDILRPKFNDKINLSETCCH